jgi:hypothetical protein
VRVAGPDDGGCAGGLRQTIGLQDVESEAEQVGPDRRIEPGSPRDEDPHRAPKHPVDPREEDGAGVQSYPSKSAVSGKETAEHQPLRGGGLRDLLHDTLMNQVEELRHAHEDRDATLSEAPQQLGRVHRLQEHHTRAH